MADCGGAGRHVSAATFYDADDGMRRADVDCRTCGRTFKNLAVRKSDGMVYIPRHTGKSTPTIKDPTPPPPQESARRAGICSYCGLVLYERPRIEPGTFFSYTGRRKCEGTERPHTLD